MKVFIKKLLREGLISEGITAGSVIVYHRTGGKIDGVIDKIVKGGFRSGKGAMYGIGVYTTYDLESQLNDYMSDTYGDTIIESKILSMDKFLIFDYDVAKMVYGNKNYTLDNQLKFILGKEWNIYKNDISLKRLIESILNTEYSSEISRRFFIEYPKIVNNLKGIVFTGKKDGKVLVVYDSKNIEPIRYSDDDGETWNNLTNKDIYNRTKKFDANSESIVSHIENSIINGLYDNNIRVLLIENFDKINFNLLLNKLNNDTFIKLINNIDDKSLVIKLINDVVINNNHILNIINDVTLNILLTKSDDKNNVIINLLDNDTFKSKINFDILKIILQNINNFNIILSKLDKNMLNNYFSSLNDNELSMLLSRSVAVYNLGVLLGNRIKNFITNLSSSDIEYYTSNQVKNPDGFVKLIDKYKNS